MHVGECRRKRRQGTSVAKRQPFRWIISLPFLCFHIFTLNFANIAKNGKIQFPKNISYNFQIQPFLPLSIFGCPFQVHVAIHCMHRLITAVKGHGCGERPGRLGTAYSTHVSCFSRITGTAHAVKVTGNCSPLVHAIGFQRADNGIL